MEDELTFQTDLFSKEHSLYSGIFVCDISACLIVVCLCFQAHSILRIMADEGKTGTKKLKISEVCSPGLQIRVPTRKLFFLFLNQNIFCGYSKEPSQ